jgi:hypothetical protein
MFDNKVFFALTIPFIPSPFSLRPMGTGGTDEAESRNKD